MRFINREAELKELREIEELSRKKLFVIAIYGLRRVGKTRLILEFLKGRGMYFFVNKNKSSADLLGEYQQILRMNGVLGELETVDSWDKFFQAVMARKTPPMVFDEFQNFGSVEPSVFGMMQKGIDLNEDEPGLIILSGSLIGLMKKLFEDSGEPLYGRIKKGRKLEPLSLKSCLEIGKELKLGKKDLMEAYFVFGGYPKYYVAIEDFGLRGRTSEEILQGLLLAKDAPLEDEANSIISQEFGARGGTYYSILEAIAMGNNTLSGIAGYLNTPMTSITRQVRELKEHFELIEVESPYIGKRGIYRIRHPLLEFWFSHIYRNYSDYAARNPEFMKKLEGGLNSAYGRAFERVALEFVASRLGLERVGRQWGKIAGAQKGENAYEIDIMGEKAGEKYAFECKWRDMGYSEAMQAIKGLDEKTKHVGIPGKARLGIVAMKLHEKERLRSGGYLAYDLDDF
jgi:AAA+ ATPase superfamily predicted ATPase